MAYAGLTSNQVTSREQPTQFANGGRNLFNRGAAETQDKARTGFGQIGRREWPDPKALASGSLRNFRIAALVRQHHGEVHTCLVAKHGDPRPQFLVDTVHQHPPSLAVENPHSADVARKMSFANKVRKHLLIEGWRAKIHGT